MELRTVRTYQNGFTIACDDTTDIYHCLSNGVTMLKKDGKSAAYKNLTLAEKFIKTSGAQEIEKPKKVQGWVRPEPAQIAPLAEQLTALPPDAPRFVLIEAGYGHYKEQGYACYDREAREIVCAHTYNGWNNVTQEKAKAEAEVAYQNEHGPVEMPKVDKNLLNAFIRAEDAYAHRYAHPLAEPTTPPAKQEVVFVTDSKYQIGDEITDKHGRLYRVTKESYWLSQRDVDDLDDQDIFGVESGWQTEARLAE